jgi:hypothetical protein
MQRAIGPLLRWQITGNGIGDINIVDSIDFIEINELTRRQVKVDATTSTS